MKNDGRKLDRKAQEAIRLMAVERVREGETPSEVIASYGMNRTTIHKWLNRSKGKGAGLRQLKNRKAYEGLDEQTRGQYCRTHGIYSHQLDKWRAAMMSKQDNEQTHRYKTEIRGLKDENKRLQRELQRKEKALAWEAHYPPIVPSWRNNWPQLTTFFDYPPTIRKVIYTTNAIESLNASLQKILKPKKSFPNDDAILKMLYLALHRIAEKWTMPIHDWKPALNQLIIVFGSGSASYTKL